MSRYDQLARKLFAIATGEVRIPPQWHGNTPPAWMGICGCSVIVNWLPMSGRCRSCNKGQQPVPYTATLLAAWLIGGPDALQTAAAGLFNDLPRST